MEDGAIRDLVARLARPHPSGGAVIERAAILAEGGDFDDIVEWITAHDGLPEEAIAAREGGLHSARPVEGSRAGRPPSRYILPAGALDKPSEAG
jgi:hypothetical protein